MEREKGKDRWTWAGERNRERRKLGERKERIGGHEQEEGVEKRKGMKREKGKDRWTWAWGRNRERDRERERKGQEDMNMWGRNRERKGWKGRKKITGYVDQRNKEEMGMKRQEGKCMGRMKEK